MSDNGKPYGTEYHTVLRSGNIKFVTKNYRAAETLMETMTKGQVYVTVGGPDILQIIYFDKDNKRTKTIDMDHSHDKKIPHVHHGYIHAENDGPKGYSNLTPQEKKMVEKVEKLWYTYLGK